MPPVQVIRPFRVHPGDTNRLIWWTFSEGPVVLMPTSAPCRLHDPNGIERSVTNTAVTTSTPFFPSFDTNGSITGQVGAAYFHINVDSAAVEGLWYIACGLGPGTPDANVGFNVERPRITLGGEVSAGTITSPVACMHKDVENLLLLPTPIDFNSEPMRERIDNYIMLAQGEFVDRTGTAYWPVLQTEEVLDIEAWRQTRADSFFPGQWFTKRPVLLKHRPVIPLDQARGHRAEFFRGGDRAVPADGSDPLTRWDDVLRQGSQGRSGGDYWVDHMRGLFFLRNSFLFRTGSVLRFTYEFGKPITTLTQPAEGRPATIHVKSTYRYQTRGIIRIGRTYIMHTGKTDNTFTGCRWGVLGTQAEDYEFCSEVYEVPDGIRAAIAMRAAALFLQGESFMAAVGDNAGTSEKISEKIKDYNERFDSICQQSHQQWGNA